MYLLIQFDSIKKLVKFDLVCGLSTHKFKIDGLYNACVQGKHAKSCFKSKEMVSTNQLFILKKMSKNTHRKLKS